MLKKHLTLLILLGLLLVFLYPASAQRTFNPPEKKEENSPKKKKEKRVRYTGWRVGGNVAAYFNTGHAANYFNGSPTNENNIAWIFNNYTWYNEIKQLVGATDTVILSEYPTAMRFKTAINLGLFARYTFGNMEFFLSGNYSKLTATDAFSVIVDPINILTFKRIELYPVYGSMNLINIDLGFARLFGDKKTLQYFVEAGVNINNCRVKESKIAIENREYNLVNIYGNQNYVPNTQMQENLVVQGGTSFGVFGGLGIKLNLSEAIAIEPGVHLYWNKFALPNYSDFNANFNGFVRLSYRLTSDE